MDNSDIVSLISGGAGRGDTYKSFIVTSPDL